MASLPSEIYMLDTSVCVAALQHDRNARRLPQLDHIALSLITVAELWTGVEKSRQRDRQAGRLERFLGSFMLLDFDEAAARAYGEIRAALETKGPGIGPLDLLIAAHARSLDATLLTGNVQEFRRVPALKVLRWK